MKTHLDSNELVAALEGDLPVSRQRHLGACEQCQSSVDEMRMTLDLVRDAGEVPEPSPAFWSHLSSRVRESTRHDAHGASISWWWAAWKPLAAGAVAATLVWAVGVRPDSRFDRPTTVDPAAEASVTPASWDDVVTETRGLSAEDLSAVTSAVTTAGFEPAFADELSPAERAMFATLVEQAMEQPR